MNKSLAISLLLLDFVTCFANAATTTATKTATATATASPVSTALASAATVQPFSTASQIILAVVLIATGLYFIVAATRYFVVLCILSGASMAGLLSYVFLSSIESAVAFSNRDLIYIIAMAIFYILGGLASWKYWTVGFPALGMLFGFLLSVWIQSFVSNGLIPGNLNGDPTVPLRFLFECIHRFVTTFGGAFIGAFATALGVDYFVNTGFRIAIAFFLGGVNSPLKFQATTVMYGLLGGILGAGIIGGLLQIYVTAPIKREYRSQAVDDKDDFQLGRSGTLHKKPIKLGGSSNSELLTKVMRSEVDVIDRISQSVARTGHQFLTLLQSREAENPALQFIQPNHPDHKAFLRRISFYEQQNSVTNSLLPSVSVSSLLRDSEENLSLVFGTSQVDTSKFIQLVAGLIKECTQTNIQ
ncbi:hypothetical protein HK096_002607, partial [Nowakowskiella sp. JEL0078]